MRTLVLLDAPSNLGLRPPAPGTVPGVYKLAGALREQGLLARLGAREGGVVVPPRYDRGEWKEGDGVFHAGPLAAYTVTLADRIEGHLRSGEFPVVLGGDCSIQLGASLAMRRLGRYGMAAIDGSADFRHPGNEAVNGPVGAAAARNWPWPPGAARPDSRTWRASRPTCATRTYGSSGCATAIPTSPSCAPPGSSPPPWARSATGAPGRWPGRP